MRWVRTLTTDLMEFGLIRRLVKLHSLQFLIIAPSTIIFILAVITIVYGVQHAGFNWGMVFTWVVWWGVLILLFVIIGRGWCITCPFGAIGEWVQRLSLWWKRKWGIELNLKWPRRLRNLWLPIGLFTVFIFLDAGYGLSNSPQLTVILIVVMIGGAIWVDLLFERRIYCRYLCPITLFIGISSMFAPFELRRKEEEVCRQCLNKDCINGNEDTYGCPMMLRHCNFTINELGYPRCHAACPAGVNSDGYINLISQGKVKEALKLHRETTSFVGVLGRVCNHPCETDCERVVVDGHVSIRSLKRFMADHELKVGREKVTPLKKTKKDKVAIVGSGPAGLACAYDLLRQGYPVTVFEAAPEAGGLLRYGIPEYRLPKEILDGEINYLEELGVEIKTNSPVKKLDDIFNHNGGYKAVFLGVGASKSPKLGIPGEDAEGVIHALDFLKRVNSGEKVELGQRVAVIGGGNAAIDAASVAQRLVVGAAASGGDEAAIDAAAVAQRLGAKEVSIIYRRSRDEMPAISSEIEEAEREGVNFNLLAAPVKILTENNRITGVQCIKMELGEPDDSGRRRPIPIEGSEFDIAVDSLIVAIGQSVDKSTLPQEIKYTDWDTVAIDPVTRQTNIAGVFAGGDVVSGPDNVIGVIADGKEAAISIERYLKGQDLKKGRAALVKRVSANGKESEERIVMPKLELEKRDSFSEVELGFSQEIATTESSRCWNCGYSHNFEGVDINRDCIICTECIKACPNDNIKLRFRRWGHDLWARTKGRLDESVGAIIIAAVVTMVSLLLVLFLPQVRSFMGDVLPAGVPPNDWPRIASIGLLYMVGVAAALLLMYGFSYLSRLFSGAKDIATKDFFINFGYALLPLGVFKFISDIIDHVFRTWGAVADVTVALAQDFPLNRAYAQDVTVKQLLSADQTYIVQLVLVAIGFAFSLYIAYKLAGRMFADKEVAFRAFLPIGTFVFVMGMAALWALSAAL
ncbi:MAG: FAD-dependent oxidoreductase [Dehalococcoidales bacterium]